jgi:hypothetical protein
MDLSVSLNAFVNVPQAVEEALINAVDSAQELLQLHARCVIQLEELTALVRGPLSLLERKVNIARSTAVLVV